MKSRLNKIVFIGAGNVATAMAKALRLNFDITQVYSLTASSAKKLGTILKCNYVSDLSAINKNADIYIIAVKDDVIEKVASSLSLKGKLVVHTSGSIEMNVLKKISDNYGVLYPLQTFSRDSIIKKGIPFCIEGSNSITKIQIKKLVKSLGGKPYELSSEKRAKLHLAAVFVNNFTNHMFTIANDILNKENIPFDLLKPLIRETIAKLERKTPLEAQTGPALRKDRKTIKKHEKMLNRRSEYLTLYKLLTKSIQYTSNNAKKL
jgi:predicted short-subunit dehydrogenase-like oxidoreductase (DUF2520 family)